MAVRFFNHMGYMITTPTGSLTAVPSRVVAYLNRAGNCYAFGTRALFFCVPLMLWTFGPSFLVAGTAALLLALYAFDRAPRDASPQETDQLIRLIIPLSGPFPSASSGTLHLAFGTIPSSIALICRAT